MQSRDCDFGEFWLLLSTFCSHISNYDCNFLHFAITFRIMTATFELWLQNVESCSQVTADFKTCSQISNYDCNFQHFAVTFRIMTAKCWKLQSRDCRFQFAVIIRNVTVTFEGVYNFRSLYFVSVKIIRFPKMQYIGYYVCSGIELVFQYS